MIWTVKVDRNSTTKSLTGKLQPNSHEQQIKYLFRAFKDRGIEYSSKEFNGPGEFKGVLKQEWANLRALDAKFGTRPSKPVFDELSDLKFRKLLVDGDLKPFTDKHHLQCCLTMGLGRYLSFRGRSEIVDSKWSQFTHSKYKLGPDEGRWRVSAKIKDGHHKGNGDVYGLQEQDKANV